MESGESGFQSNNCLLEWPYWFAKRHDIWIWETDRKVTLLTPNHITIMNKAKFCLVLHFVFLCAFLVIFITVGGDDYVRWNLDAILFVGTILSALAWLRLTRHEKTDNSIYNYLLLYSTFGIIVALFMSIVLGFWLNMKGENSRRLWLRYQKGKRWPNTDWS